MQQTMNGVEKTGLVLSLLVPMDPFFVSSKKKKKLAKVETMFGVREKQNNHLKAVRKSTGHVFFSQNNIIHIFVLIKTVISLFSLLWIKLLIWHYDTLRQMK